MGSIPLPNDSQPLIAPADPLSAYQRAQVMLQQRQIQAQQLQHGQLENQQQQQQIADQKASTDAMLNWDGKNIEEIPSLILKHGGSAAAVFTAKQQILKQKESLSQMAKDDAETGAKNIETAAKKNDMLLGALQTVTDGPSLLAAAQNAVQQGLMDPQHMQQAQQIAQLPPDQFKQTLSVYEKGLQGHKEQFDQAAKLRDEALAKRKQDFEESAGLPVEKLGMMDYLRTVKGATPAGWPAYKAAQEARATQPYKIQTAYAEAQARQQAQQGDPSVAGKMLANGDLTLTDLKSRGTTPQYITKAIEAAQKVDPNYKAGDEVVAESVAKSQGANQFFGSANSLITKGGTLDQLAELGKKIPQGQFPTVNKIEDWEKLATGKGPLAGYAATALGAADDYGKVMGGGTASDSAREHALRLFSQAASPEQRQAAIDATRNAVKSQRDERIGKNQFLKRQYGAEVSNGSGGLSVQAPNGKTYSFKDQQSLDNFKKAAGIQ